MFTALGGTAGPPWAIVAAACIFYALAARRFDCLRRGRVGWSAWKKDVPLRRQSDDHHFGSLLMLAVTAGAFLLVTWIAREALLMFLRESPFPFQSQIGADVVACRHSK